MTKVVPPGLKDSNWPDRPAIVPRPTQFAIHDLDNDFPECTRAVVYRRWMYTGEASSTLFLGGLGDPSDTT